MIDRTQAHLDELLPDVRQRAHWLIYVLRFYGVPAIITDARRSSDEQQRLVATGRSLTLTSKHLSGRAFDVGILGVVPDDVPSWLWDGIGVVGEALGLTWGGRWRNLVDKPHFEL